MTLPRGWRRYLSQGWPLVFACVVTLPLQGADLIHHWELEEASGLVVSDGVGGADAQFVNMDEDAWVEGRVGEGALAFDNLLEQFVRVDEPEEFDVNVDHSWAAWVRTTVDGSIMAKGPTEVSWDDELHRGGRGLFLGNGQLTYDVGWVGAVGQSGGNSVVDGNWHHVAVTTDINEDLGNDTVMLFVDGEVVATKSDWDVDQWGPNIGDVKFGSVSPDFPEGGNNFFTGELDDIRWYEGALTQEEVADIIRESTECPEMGDTVCDSIDVVGPGDSNGTGIWTITVEGSDESDDPILYTVTAEGGAGDPIVIGPQAEGVFRLTLNQPGTWTVTVLVDDSAICDDAIEGNTCTSEVEVVEGGGGGDDLVAAWCLDEGGGLTTADFAGGDNDAALTNMEEDAWTEGVVGDDGALTFDGFDDYLLAENPEAIDTSTDYTWSAWINTEVDGSVMAKGPTEESWDAEGYRAGMGLFTRNGVLTFDVGWVGAVGGTTFLLDGEWHHVAVTAEFSTDGDNDTVRLFVDGEQEAERFDWNISPESFGETNSNTIGDVRIGNVSPDFPREGNHFFTGVIDDVRIYSRALEPDEILELFDEPGLGCGATEEGLFRRGDVDANGLLDISDPVSNLTFQFLGTFEPTCMDALDWDDSGTVEITDPLGNLTRQFLGGAPAPAPGSEVCGPDPSADGLNCENGGCN